MPDKDNKKHGHYFTFPIKFLWVKTPEEYREACRQCIDYSIYKYMECMEGPGTPKTKYEQAKEDLNFKGGNLKETYECGERLEKTIQKGDIYTSVKTSYLFHARDGRFDMDLLLLVAAVKSKIGPKRNFTYSTRSEIIRRMYGEEKEIPYRTWRKLIATARMKHICTFLPSNKGYYVSVRYRTAKLTEEVKTSISKFMQSEDEARQGSSEIRALKKSYRENRHK